MPEAVRIEAWASWWAYPFGGAAGVARGIPIVSCACWSWASALPTRSASSAMVRRAPRPALPPRLITACACQHGECCDGGGDLSVVFARGDGRIGALREATWQAAQMRE